VPDPERLQEVTNIMRAAGRAHHEAVGGPSPTWADWYANQMVGSLGPAVGLDPTVSEVSSWLVECDEQHRLNAPEEKWPAWYAGYLLDVIIPRIS
jgi:hypothetical protein